VRPSGAPHLAGGCATARRLRNAAVAAAGAAAAAVAVPSRVVGFAFFGSLLRRHDGLADVVHFSHASIQAVMTHSGWRSWRSSTTSTLTDINRARYLHGTSPAAPVAPRPCATPRRDFDAGERAPAVVRADVSRQRLQEGVNCRRLETVAAAAAQLQAAAAARGGRPAGRQWRAARRSARSTSASISMT